MNSKIYRLREFINPASDRSLIIETSSGLSLGPLPGLEHFAKTVIPVLPLIDGLVVSPGQVRKLTGRTRNDAALLVRADWTNALRSPDFVLPPEKIEYVPLLGPQDALDLGVNALVVYFLLGFEEDIEADCLKRTVQMAISGSQIGMPLIVDVQPIGPRVVQRNQAIELGVSYALESGADGVAIPWPGPDSLEHILAMAAEAPVWIKPSSINAVQNELDLALELGVVGMWLGEEIFRITRGIELLDIYRARIHQAEPAVQG